VGRLANERARRVRETYLLLAALALGTGRARLTIVFGGRVHDGR
jgi:hypothetical protein